MPIEQALKEAAQCVLETMFFAESEPAAAPGPVSSDKVRVEVPFEGHRRGRLAMEIPRNCAGAMAASFEGMPDAGGLPEGAIEHVAAELSNMICGATLTRLDPDGLFHLGTPALTQEAVPAPSGFAAVECWLLMPSIDGGLMHLTLALEEAA